MWFKGKNSDWFAKDFSFFLGIFKEKEAAFLHHLEQRGLWSIAIRAANIHWVQQA